MSGWIIYVRPVGPWEEGILGAPKAPAPNLPETKEATETVLVDRAGRPLIVKRPRSFGFRPPEAKP